MKTAIAILTAAIAIAFTATHLPQGETYTAQQQACLNNPDACTPAQASEMRGNGWTVHTDGWYYPGTVADYKRAHRGHRS